MQPHHWPTPDAALGDGGKVSRGGARKGELLLAGEAQRWPTPTSRDHKDGSEEACAGVPVNGLLGRFVHGNRPEVRGWPTVRVSDGNGAGAHGEGGPDLRTKAGGALNPAWVAALMGWPLNWESLEPLTELDWPALHGAWPAPPGPYQHPWEPPRVASGIKDRAKRLRCLGNGQVPFSAALAWRLLAAAGGEGESNGR